MKNKQVIINSLPEDKLTESNYRLVESEIPEISSDQVLVKTISFVFSLPQLAAVSMISLPPSELGDIPN